MQKVILIWKKKKKKKKVRKRIFSNNFRVGRDTIKMHAINVNFGTRETFNKQRRFRRFLTNRVIIRGTFFYL